MIHKKSNIHYWVLTARLLVCLALGGFMLPIALPSAALSASDHTQTYQFNIPAQSLSKALLQFSKVTNIAILAPAKLLGDIQSAPLQGMHSPEKALSLILKGSLISFDIKDNKTIILKNTSIKTIDPKANYEVIVFNSDADYQRNLSYFDADEYGNTGISSGNPSDVDEIFITSHNRETDKTKMSFSTKLLLDIPGTFNDPLWGFMTTPGITFGDEVYDGTIIIRGGGPDDNLFLLDGMYVGYIFHALGDGIFSKNTIHRFDLHASAFGAEYGNAIGSVVDIGLRNPDRSRFRGQVDINILKTGFQIETPVGENGGFYLDARLSTLHLIIPSFDNEKDLTPTVERTPKSFDYTSRYRYEKDGLALTVTVTGAQDREEHRANSLVASTVPVGSKTKKNFNTQALSVEKHWDNGANFETIISRTTTNRRHTYGIGRFEDLSQTGTFLRSKFDKEVGRHFIMTGVNYSRIKGVYDYETRLAFCDDYDSSCAYSDFETRIRKDTFSDIQIYLKDIIAISDTVDLELGAQFSRDFFLKESFIEPRLGISWQASDAVKVYVRGGRYHQRQSAEKLLTLRNTARIQKNDKSTHFMIGTQAQIADNWYMSLEGYHKSQTTISYPKTLQERKVDGKIYGFEITLSRPPRGRGLSGAISMGYVKTTRKDQATKTEIDYRFNRPFSAVIGAKYTFGGGWSFGGKYQIQSGSSYTPVTGVNQGSDGNFYFDYGSLYSSRTNAYKQLDIRLEKIAHHSFGEVNYHLDVLNALAQTTYEKPSYTNIQPDGQGGYTVIPFQSDGTPLIISIGVGISF